MIVTANLNPKRPYNYVCPKYNIVSKYNYTNVYWKFISISGYSWVGTVSLDEFTTKHQTNVSAIHSTQLIVLVKAISLQGVNILLTTASRIWNDVINPAEWFIIFIVKMHVYSQGHINVCAKWTFYLHHIVLEKKCLKRSQDMLEILSHHQLILCYIESVANFTYKHPKI